MSSQRPSRPSGTAAAEPVTLGELLAGIAPVPEAAAGVEIAGLAYDSRRVEPGTLFCCVSGFEVDGHDFAAKAVADGAAALLVERPLGLGVPEIEVPSVRAAMGPLAARFYGDPTAELQVVGITGTNGKTTTAYLVRALLEAAGIQTGLLGTVTSIVGGSEHPVQRTTPEAIDLQADFRAMLDAGDEACAIEVSSHALALGRTRGIKFGAAVFTNLTQDHLDFHPTMEDYFTAKRSLFLPDAGGEGSAGDPDAPSDVAAPGVSVVNVGDSCGRRLAGEIEGPVTFAVATDGAGEAVVHADYTATDLRCDAAGCRFVLHTPAVRPAPTGRSAAADRLMAAGQPQPGSREVVLPMPGRFNVENALGALAAVHGLGYDLDPLVHALERGVRVPGRFEPIDAGQEFAVLVDYAHTPDSLENVLSAVRDIAAGRVVCVFGAGGDRDRGKRPLMGEIAARLADVAIVTSDNPRSEEPETIVAEIVAGIPDGSLGAAGSAGQGARAEARVVVEVDRRRAIERAVATARAGDVVVIAGKGHEQGQEVAGGVKLPFDDATVAREVLAARGARVVAAADVEAATGSER